MNRVVTAVVFVALTCTALTGLRPTVAHAETRTLYVPSRYHTISSAVKAAHNGDTILVSAGTYHENVTINGKYVVLKARSSDPASTVIIGKAGRTPVMIANVPARAGVPKASLIGFRITGGSAPNGQGGAVTTLTRADPVIQGNLIEGNKSSRGGGIVIYDRSNPSIISNTIRNNRASFLGGGIFVAMGSNPRIYANTITGNHAAGGTIRGGGPSGGGIYVTNDGNHPTAPRSHPNISRNNISNNTASFAGGGVVLGTGADATVRANRISGNRSAYGGGIHIENHGAHPSVSDNVISSNAAGRVASYPGSGSGGGISVFGGSRPGIGHNTISNNAASYNGGGLVLAEGSSSQLNGNRITANVVTRAGGWGGGIAIAQAAARITNNVIRGNRVSIGGGIAALGTGKLELVNNTILSNTATQGGTASGGGIYIGAKPAATASIFNNVFAGNNDFQIFEYGKIATYGNNDIVNDGRGMFFSFPAHALHTSATFNGNPHLHYAQGNIDVAPSFVNAGTGDVRMNIGSAGIDAGRLTGAPPFDIAGHVRPAGRRVDIGAYER
jgi:parallel beta-helix repeat protein